MGTEHAARWGIAVRVGDVELGTFVPTSAAVSAGCRGSCVGRGNLSGSPGPPLCGGGDLADEPGRPRREELEATRQGFGAGARHAFGRPFGPDDDLYQVRRIEWMGCAPDEWAEARGVPLVHAKAHLRRFHQRHRSGYDPRPGSRFARGSGPSLTGDHRRTISSVRQILQKHHFMCMSTSTSSFRAAASPVPVASPIVTSASSGTSSPRSLRPEPLGRGADRRNNSAHPEDAGSMPSLKPQKVRNPTPMRQDLRRAHGSQRRRRGARGGAVVRGMRRLKGAAMAVLRGLLAAIVIAFICSSSSSRSR